MFDEFILYLNNVIIKKIMKRFVVIENSKVIFMLYMILISIVLKIILRLVVRYINVNVCCILLWGILVVKVLNIVFS